MFLNEQENQRLVEKLRQAWSKAFWPLLALLCGVLLGVLGTRSEIINDCKYSGSFRVDSQAFNCQRKI